MQVGSAKIAILDQYLASLRVVDSASTTAAPLIVASWLHSLSLVIGVVCCLWEMVDEVFMMWSLNVTSKITEQNLIVHSGKCKAAVIKDYVYGIILLKLTRPTGSIAQPICDSW